MSYDSFFTTITWLGSLYCLLPATAVLFVWLRWTGRSHEMLMLGTSLSATVVAVHAAKMIFRRPRPESLDFMVPMPSDWSFPSGHTAQATAFFLTLAIIAARTLPPVAARFCAGASAMIIIGVAWSRVYLQVHYLSDVVAGFILAAIVVAAAHNLFPYPHPPRGK